MLETLTCTAKVRRDGGLENCLNARASQDPNATNRHCTACQTAARKRNDTDKNQQQSARAWHEGVSAMADHLAKNFEPYLIQRFSGKEIADIIRRCERPKFGETSLASDATS
jgi:hypothetical protein